MLQYLLYNKDLTVGSTIPYSEVAIPIIFSDLMRESLSLLLDGGDGR